MRPSNAGLSQLDDQYDGLKDALFRVNYARTFSRWTGFIFFGVVLAGGWHLYDGWFKRSEVLPLVGLESEF